MFSMYPENKLSGENNDVCLSYRVQVVKNVPGKTLRILTRGNLEKLGHCNHTTLINL